MPHANREIGVPGGHPFRQTGGTKQKRLAGARGAVLNRDIVPQRYAETVLSYLETRVLLLYSACEGIVMKPLLFALCVVFAFGGLRAQTPAWQPSPGHTQVPI